MYLSQLVYECIKYGVYQDDTKFTYQAFVDGEYNDVVDFKNQINNVWFPLNEAIHRLSVKDKIPNRVVLLNVEDNIGKLEGELINIRNIRNVFQVNSDGYKKVGHRRVGNMIILYNFDSGKEVYAEYRVDIPNFNNFEDNDYELKDTYGISETACSFIIEYVKSGLLEQVAPEIAYQHRSIAEQYFNDLETYNNGFEQQIVQPKYKIEW